MLLFVALAVMAIAATPVVAGAAPTFEKADGTGESPEYGAVHVNAKDQGDGPRGHWFVSDAVGTPFQGDVTCLRQEGNTALVGGLGRNEVAPGVLLPILIEVVDNGQPGHGADQHRWRFAFPDEVADPDCADFGDNPPRANIVRGNYVVPTGSGG
ncbi:MAG TPA: hypothetical protein VF517_17415 [Thermoleophilaceae bacterium]|jgi:hypothetical protein